MIIRYNRLLTRMRVGIFCATEYSCLGFFLSKSISVFQLAFLNYFFHLNTSDVNSKKCLPEF